MGVKPEGAHTAQGLAMPVAAGMGEEGAFNENAGARSGTCQLVHLTVGSKTSLLLLCLHPWGMLLPRWLSRACVGHLPIAAGRETTD